MLGQSLIQLIKKLPPCVFHTATGYYCPGCGGSRAVIALITGHPIKSALYHPFFFYAVVMCLLFGVSFLIAKITKGKVKLPLYYHDGYLWIAIGLILLNCAIKNISLAVWGIDLLELIQ